MAAGWSSKVTTDGVLTDSRLVQRRHWANPAAALTLGNDGNFYGTTTSGGGQQRSGNGVQVDDQWHVDQDSSPSIIPTELFRSPR